VGVGGANPGGGGGRSVGTGNSGGRVINVGGVDVELGDDIVASVLAALGIAAGE